MGTLIAGNAVQDGRLFDLAREWLLTGVPDDSPELEERILGGSDEDTVKRITRAYAGGWNAFARDHSAAHSATREDTIPVATRKAQSEKGVHAT